MCMTIINPQNIVVIRPSVLQLWAWVIYDPTGIRVVKNGHLASVLQKGILSKHIRIFGCSHASNIQQSRLVNLGYDFDIPDDFGSG